MTPIRLLHVEDDALFCQIVRLAINGDKGVQLDCVHDIESVPMALTPGKYDGVLLDLSLPDSKGIATLHRLREINGNVAIIVITGVEITPELHEALIEAGADEVLGKDIWMANRALVIARVEHAKAKADHRYMESIHHTFDRIYDRARALYA